MGWSARSPRGRALAFLCVGLAILGGGGCGKDGVGKTVPVKGQVVVAGQPLPLGSLVYRPDNSKGNTSTFEPGSSIDSSGNYELFTNGKPGAPLGWYKVTIVAEEAPDSTRPNAVKSKISRIYKDPQTTPLSIEVKEGAPSGAYDLKLKK